MIDAVEVHAIVRKEMLDRVVHQLKAAGLCRLTVTPVHAVGCGVDPATAGVSSEEGTEYTPKAMVQFVCGRDCCDRFIELVARSGRTGRRGDGIVYVTPVRAIVQIRTGATGLEALH